jgi:ketosteroid isomerase-like protein
MEPEEAEMQTRELLQRYFRELDQQGGWQAFLADDLSFTSFTTPIKQVAGKAAYLESTRRFFSMIRSVELRTLIVEGVQACALTRYGLEAPTGARFQSDVAEVFRVEGGKIAELAIYFDSAPFPK